MHRNICSMYANVVKTFKFCNKYPQSDYVQSISIKYNINFVENIFFMLSMNLKKKKWLWWRYSFNVLSIPRNVKLYESRGKKNKNHPFPFSIVYNYAIIRNTEFSSSRYPIYQRSIYEPYNCIELDGKIKISHSIFPHLI